MALTLHIFSGAPPGWRVHLGLAFKGVAHEIRRMSNDNKDQHQPEFLVLNPRGTAPVLEADGIVLRDSIAILAWLDRKYPQKPLFGANANQAAEIWRITMECCEFLREAIRQLLTRVFPSDGTVPEEGSPDRNQLQAAADLAHAECRYLEQILSHGGPYLGGDTPSAADAVAFPEIRLMQRAVETKHALMSAIGFGFPSELYPNVASWKQRLNNDAGVAGTIPPHWGTGPLEHAPAA